MCALMQLNWKEYIKKTMKLNVNRNDLQIFLLTLPFFKPGLFASLDRLNMIDNIFDIALVISMAIILCLSIKNRIFNKCMIIFSVWMFLILFLTIDNQGSFYLYLRYYATVFCFFLFVNITYYFDCLENLLRILYLILGIEIVINYITIIIAHPVAGNAIMYYGGSAPLYNTYFLGIDNLHCTYYILFLCVSYIYDNRRLGRLSLFTYILQFLIIISVLMCWSVTTLLGIVAYFIFMLLSKNKKIALKVFHPISVIGFNIFIFVIVVFTDIQESFYAIITYLFNKNINSLLARQQFWARTIYYFIQSKYLGVGIEDELLTTAKLYAPHAHNTYLEFMYISGILGLILIILMVYEAVNKADVNNKEHMCLCSGICAFLFLFETEYYAYNIGFFSIVTLLALMKKK